MNDESLIRLLGRLDRPVDPNPAFAERLFGVVRVEAARPRRVPVRNLLAAAALLVLTLSALSAYLLATQPRDDRAVVVPPANDLPRFVGTEVWSATGRFVGPDVYLTVANGQVWLTQSGPDYEPPKVVRVDVTTGAVATFDLPGQPSDVEQQTGLGPPTAGANTLYFTGGSSRADGTGPNHWGLWQMDLAAPGVFAYSEFAAGTGAEQVDERGENWFQHEGLLSLRRADGSTQWNVPVPWDVSEGSALNQLSAGASFGSLWAYRASVNEVLRLDLESGGITASIDLPGCVSKAGSNARGIPERLYPLTGVSGLPDAMVFVCASDGGQTRLVVIDQAVNRAVATFDVGTYNGSFGVPGQALVYKGHLLLPLAMYRSSYDSSTQIVEVDPASWAMKVIYEMPVGQHIGSPATPVFVSGDSLWTLATPDDEGQTHKLLRLTPEDKYECNETRERLDPTFRGQFGLPAARSWLCCPDPDGRRSRRPTDQNQPCRPEQLIQRVEQTHGQSCP